MRWSCCSGWRRWAARQMRRPTTISAACARCLAGPRWRERRLRRPAKQRPRRRRRPPSHWCLRRRLEMSIPVRLARTPNRIRRLHRPPLPFGAETCRCTSSGVADWRRSNRCVSPTPLPRCAGLAYDAVSRRFIVADREARKLTVVDEFSQHVANLASAQSAGFGSIAALEIDTRQGNLWVVSTDTASATDAAQAAEPRAYHPAQAAADIRTRA